MKRLLFLFLLLAGCLQSPPPTSTPSPSVQPIFNLTNITTQNTTVQTAPPKQVELCMLSQGGLFEWIVFDRDRYAYEANFNGSLIAEMVYAKNTLYLRLLPPFAGCEWTSLNAEDLAGIKKLGDVATLPYAEMRNRVPAQFCQPVPLIEKVFTAPTKACPIKELILKGAARQIG